MLVPNFRRLSLFLLFLLIINALYAQSNRNVLVIGIDGLRGDAFMASPTPHIDGFMNAGEYSYDCDAGIKTIHGPSWASILTGVWSRKHNIKTDLFKKPMLDLNPHISMSLNDHYRTASFVKWAPINEQLDCCSQIKHSGNTDEMVKNKTLGAIERDEADFIFAQFGDVNEAGEVSEYGPNSPLYKKAISRMDNIFADILSAIQHHSLANNEEWMIILCTDHGGHENGHNGRQKMTEVRMVPQILAFCRKDGTIGIDLQDNYVSLTDAANVNIVPTILDYLGYPLPEYLDGQSYFIPVDESVGIQVRN